MRKPKKQETQRESQIANCVYLPTEEDVKIKVCVSKDAEPVELDILLLDDLISDAVSKGDKSGLPWYEELPNILKQECSISLTSSQCRFLYMAVRARIEEIKKKL